MISIAELRRAGVVIRSEEAVAIAQKLIHDRRHLTATAPSGPPSIDNVAVGDDGSVACGCDATPGAADLASFLQSLLPDGAVNVPGALRYTIARALHQVDAPPFDSLEALSAALSRHERGDRNRIVQRLASRGATRSTDAGGEDGRTERRRGCGTPSDYRRLLREADERLYQQKLALESVSPAPPSEPQQPERGGARVAVTVAVAMVILAAAEAMRLASPAIVVPPSVPASPEWTETVPPRVADQISTESPLSLHRDARRPVQASSRQRPRPRRKSESVLLNKFRIVLSKLRVVDSPSK